MRYIYYSCRYKPIVEDALKLSNVPDLPTIVYQRPNLPEAEMIPGKDVDWREALNKARGHDCVDLEANEPLYVLYTSGTTGT